MSLSHEGRRVRRSFCNLTPSCERPEGVRRAVYVRPTYGFGSLHLQIPTLTYYYCDSNDIVIERPDRTILLTAASSNGSFLPSDAMVWLCLEIENGPR